MTVWNRYMGVQSWFAERVGLRAFAAIRLIKHASPFVIDRSSNGQLGKYSANTTHHGRNRCDLTIPETDRLSNGQFGKYSDLSGRLLLLGVR